MSMVEPGPGSATCSSKDVDGDGLPRNSAFPRHVIAMAASAGGIKALTKVLSDLPPEIAAAILIVQHVSPHHPSLLDKVLQRRTTLRVKQAESGEPIREGIVLVAPPNQHLSIGEDGKVCLTQTPKVNYSRPSADPLFASVAKVYGPRTIFVVLSGFGRDGSIALPAAKAQGAYILAQDQATSWQFSMPRAAIETGAVDEVLPLDRIGPRLIELTSVRDRRRNTLERREPHALRFCALTQTHRISPPNKSRS